MKKLFVIAASALVAAGAVATTAQATPAPDCGIGTLAAQSRAASLDRLAEKAEAAAAKLAEGKPADALEKLVDYDAALDALIAAPKPKIDAGTYAVLNADVESAIACLTGAAGA